MAGGLRVGDTLELPELRLQKKAKSMQMFRCGRVGELGGKQKVCSCQPRAAVPGRQRAVDAGLPAKHRVSACTIQLLNHNHSHVCAGSQCRPAVAATA